MRLQQPADGAVRFHAPTKYRFTLTKGPEAPFFALRSGASHVVQLGPVSATRRCCEQPPEKISADRAQATYRHVHPMCSAMGSIAMQALQRLCVSPELRRSPSISAAC
jgi:hypothetical protein